MLSPLKTQRIWLDRINIALAHSAESGDQEKYETSVDLHLRKRPDALSFRIGLEMILTPAAGAHCRYNQISIKTVGIFELPNDTSEEYIKAVVPLNCLAILHGFARGVVAQITGLNEGGPVLLPTVNFEEALKEARAHKKPESKPANQSEGKD
ncbi:MAG: protein-export chaperone SecB [Armatimonadota bacterium]|jgi:preprotein translocase subunit SecB